jgi:hypothetical protein
MPAVRLRPLAALRITAAVGVGLLLASCSTSPAKSSTSTSTTQAKSTTTQATASTTTTGPVSVSSCQPSQLRIEVSGSGGAAGTIELTFSLTDSTSVSCTMQGYPGMLLLDASGAALPTTVVRGGSLSFKNIAATAVSLSPSETAYFNLGYSDVTAPCSMASQVEVTPPNDTAHATVPVTSLQACNNGTLTVSPVFASSNAAATETTAPPLP